MVSTSHAFTFGAHLIRFGATLDPTNHSITVPTVGTFASFESNSAPQRDNLVRMSSVPSRTLLYYVVSLYDR